MDGSKQLKFGITISNDQIKIIAKDIISSLFFKQNIIQKVISQRLLKKFLIEHKGITTILKQINEVYALNKSNSLQSSCQMSGQVIVKDLSGDMLQLKQSLNEVSYLYLPNKNKLQQQRNKKLHSLLLKILTSQLYVKVLSNCLTLKNKNFQQNQLIIFYLTINQHKLNRFIHDYQTFNKEVVIFGLDQFVGGRDKILKLQFQYQDFITILQKLIKYLQESFNHIAQAAKIKINKAIPYVDLKHNKTQSIQYYIGITFQIQGFFRSLPQFYFNLLDLFRNHNLTFIDFQEIQRRGTFNEIQKNLYQEQKIKIFFGSQKSCGVINFKTHFKQNVQLKKLLLTGVYLISQQQNFTASQISTLIAQRRQLDIFLSEKTIRRIVLYKFIQNDQYSFFIKCQKQFLYRFLEGAKDYLFKNTKVQCKRKEFQSEFQIYVFMHNLRSLVEREYTSLSFQVKNGQLYSHCKQSDLQNLKNQMDSVKKKMLKSLVKIPTIKKLKDRPYYKIRQQAQFCAQGSCITRQYLVNNKVGILIKPISSISYCLDMVIFLIDCQYKHYKFFSQCIKQNQLHIQHLFQNFSSKKSSPMIQFLPNKSKYLNWNESQKVRGKVYQFIRKQNDTDIKIVIPCNMNWANVNRFLIDLLREIQCQDHKIDQITLFYQADTEKNVLEIIQKCVKEQRKDLLITKSTRLYLTTIQIQRIMLMQYYSVKYWQEKNKLLSPLNSYIFNYQKSKTRQKFKVPVFVRSSEQIQLQYLLCIKKKEYFRIQNPYKVSLHKLNQNQQLLKLSKVISYYFDYCQYLVVYLNSEGKINTSLYYWTKQSDLLKKEKSGQILKRIKINQQNKLISIDEPLNCNVKKNKHLQQYAIETFHQYKNQIKKKIFQDN